MTGLLLHAPTPSELERLYYELARRGAPSVGRRSKWPYRVEDDEHLLVLASQMLRHDPRLLSILLQWVLESWSQFDLIALRRWLRQVRWPQALLVVFGFARQARPDDSELRYVAEYLCAGWPRVSPPERFFFDVERPGSRRAERRKGRSLSAYSRWGFIGTERPSANAFTKEVVGRYDMPTRVRIAARLATPERGLSVREYLDAIEHSVSRQQARKDLQAAGLVPSGVGRGARWTRP